MLVSCGGGGFNAASATSQIKTNWSQFFDSTKSIEQHQAVLQNGSQLRAALQQQLSNPLSHGVSANATTVVIAADHKTAQVTFDILRGSSVLLHNSAGSAVLDQGVWKVSKETFCTLARLGASAGQTVPGC